MGDKNEKLADCAGRWDRGRGLLFWAAVVAWLSGGAVLMAAVWIRFGHVMHPGWWWVGIALVVTIVAAACGLVVLIRTGRERSWWAAAKWAIVLVLPAMVSVAPLVYGLLTMSALRRPIAERRLPVGRGWQQLSGAMGASLLDAAARVVYPRRAAGEHVVMLYKSAANPEADVAAMDAHVEGLSALLGRPCAAKVHWVRGGLCGVSRMYFQGMSFGSDSRDGEGGPTELDRHEVAHFVIEYLAGPYAQPPSMLQEGWAQAQMGRQPGWLASQALAAWAANPRLGPAALVGRGYYDSREAIVYLQGGGFADFLLRRYGGPKFFELYHTCRERSFAEDCERVLGVSLAELERLYSEDLEQQALQVPDRDGLVKEPFRLTAESGRPSTVFVWVERQAMEKVEPPEDVNARKQFLEQYPAALARLRQSYDSVAMAAKTRYHRTLHGEERQRGEVLEVFAQDGSRWRARTVGELPEQICISTPEESIVFTATGMADRYLASKKLPNGLSFEAEYGAHARLLPYRLGHRDISELFSDKSFVVRDIVALQVDGRDAVRLRYERMGGRERGHVTFDPGRAWAVLDFEKSETYGNGPERVETWRFQYADEDPDRPVVAGLLHRIKTEQAGRAYEEQTDLTSVSFGQPDGRLFQGPAR